MPKSDGAFCLRASLSASVDFVWKLISPWISAGRFAMPAMLQPGFPLDPRGMLDCLYVGSSDGIPRHCRFLREKVPTLRWDRERVS